MKILHVATEYPPAKGYGVGRYISELARAQAANGHDVHVLTQNFLSGKTEYLEEGVTVHLLHEPPPPLPYKKPPAGVLWMNQRMVGRAVEIWKEHGPFDLLAVHDWLGVHVGKAVRDIFDMRLAVTIHDTEIGKSFGKLTREQQYIADVEKWACGLCDLLIVNSEFIAEEVRRYYSPSDEKMRMVYPGVNLDYFRQVDVDKPRFRARFAREYEKIVLFVGRMEVMKGVHRLVEAVPQILASRPDVRFVLAGTGTLEKPLKERVKAMQVEDRAAFVGHVSGKALVALYKCADLLVVPSLYEPFGMVALEGTAAGTRTIVAESGGLKEIAAAVPSVTAFQPDRAPALAAAVTCSLSADRNANLQAGIDRFSWQVIAEEVVESYRAVARQGVGAR